MTKIDLIPSINLIRMMLEPTHQSTREDSHTYEEFSALDSNVNNITEKGLPSEIANLIKRRITSQNTFKNPIPSVGQIRKINRIQNNSGDSLAAQLSILLLKKDSENWSGLAVSPYVNYANSKDILLESYYESVFDPMVGVIHTSIPITVQEAQLGEMQATLSNTRLQAVEEVVRGAYTFKPTQYQAGKFIFAKTASGHDVTIGYPESDNDYRHEYHDIYTTLSALAEASLKDRVSLLDKFWNSINKLSEELQKGMLIKDQVSYAMSNTQPLKRIELDFGLTMTPVVDEAIDDLLVLQIDNHSATQIEIEVSQNDRVIQAISSQPQTSDELFLEAGHSYTVQLNSSETHKTLEIDL